ncbi:cell division protein FtsA [Listeria floridensis FSL S10-1187]|uniref:Cell division protein FtsA n=1 Tax=Listeria floridensis FSL S10-1187 TaxID=1265817 RepID=A0ABN0RFH1_9LIST|nr:cell division protein FtsA [Listeria floridensis FSL S10-1187]
MIDIDKTVESIKKAIRKAERMVGVEISQVIVGIVSNQITLENCHGVVAINSDTSDISDQDVWNVLDAAQVAPLQPEREIISLIPHQFVVDGFSGITDPRGMSGIKLEVEGSLVTGSKTILHNTLRCVERAGLDIAEIVLQPLAEASVTMTEDDKEFGTALINVGAGTTTVSVFDQGKLLATCSIPVGGENITKDLSLGLNTSTANAEKVKLEHGYAFYEDASQDEVFSVDVIGSDKQQHFNQLEIADIIEARLEEIFVLAQDELKRIGIKNLPGGFILTGGTMAMPGAIDLAAQVLGEHVRLAMPDYIGVRDPAYTTAVGLIQYAYNLQELEGSSFEDESYDYEEEVQPVKKAKPSKPKKSDEEKVTTKMKNFFGAFFE